MKKFIAAVNFFFVCASTYAQTDGTGTTVPISNWLTENWESIIAIVVGIYEIIVRYFPTAKNYSLLTIVMRIIQAFIPNYNKQKNGTHD